MRVLQILLLLEISALCAESQTLLINGIRYYLTEQSFTEQVGNSIIAASNQRSNDNFAEVTALGKQAAIEPNCYTHFRGQLDSATSKWFYDSKTITQHTTTEYRYADYYWSLNCNCWRNGRLVITKHNSLGKITESTTSYRFDDSLWQEWAKYELEYDYKWNKVLRKQYEKNEIANTWDLQKIMRWHNTYNGDTTIIIEDSSASPKADSFIIADSVCIIQSPLKDTTTFTHFNWHGKWVPRWKYYTVYRQDGLAVMQETYELDALNNEFTKVNRYYYYYNTDNVKDSMEVWLFDDQKNQWRIHRSESKEFLNNPTDSSTITRYTLFSTAGADSISSLSKGTVFYDSLGRLIRTISYVGDNKGNLDSTRSGYRIYDECNIPNFTTAIYKAPLVSRARNAMVPEQFFDLRGRRLAPAYLNRLGSGVVMQVGKGTVIPVLKKRNHGTLISRDDLSNR